MMDLLRHICEVCGREEILTSEEAFDDGWDYPPRMGQFGVISPRLCPDCPTEGSLWWAFTVDHLDAGTLSESQQTTLQRILREPQTIAVDP